MKSSLTEIVQGYDPDLPLVEASTPPAPWYTDARILALEQATVFSRSWQLVGRAEQVREAGHYLTSRVAGEPVLVIRGDDGRLRGFFNVCRHHGAAVASETEGRCGVLRCRYHGWTYDFAGRLIGAPDFADAAGFERSANGLVPIETSQWGKWVFVNLDGGAPALEDFLGADLIGRVGGLGLDRFHWLERRSYVVDCNWKVFVDNYLDGGYHVPHIHGALDSVLDSRDYTVENGARFCAQSCAIASDKADPETAAVRGGRRANYFWLYPNFMINCYESAMDTNFVFPRGVERTEVIFDYYFPDISPRHREQHSASIAVSERIQNEDAAICESVQGGLNSRAYGMGRLSPRREAGEQLFHRLLHRDLKTGIEVGRES